MTCFSLQLQKYDVQKLDEIFDTEGEGGVTMDLMIDIENLPHLERDLELTTRGRASVSDLVSDLSRTVCKYLICILLPWPIRVLIWVQMSVLMLYLTAFNSTCTSLFTELVCQSHGVSQKRFLYNCRRHFSVYGCLIEPCTHSTWYCSSQHQCP